MKGCSLKGGKKSGRKQRAGRTRRHKKMLAFPASNTASQSAFSRNYLAYTGQNGGSNPNLPYGQSNYDYLSNGVSKPQNLKGGGVINQAVITGANSVKGGRRKKGGNSGRWPDGLTGSAWGTNVSQWPGVDRISGDRNYLSHNDYKYDPQTEGVVNGRALSGGGLIPQDLVNMGRQAMFGLGSTYNALAGYSAPTNPMPYKDQLKGV